MATVSDFLAEWRSPCPYVEAHTSGSTGTPKTIRLPKADMLVSARATCRFFGLGAGSVLALPLSVDYIAGKMMAVRAEVCGGRLLELPVSNDVAVPESVDLLAVVPSQIPGLLASGTAPLVRHLLVGGAPLPDAAANTLVRAGIDAWMGYGMTETCSHVALRRIGAGGDIYTAMPGITFSTDGRGCLVVHSDDFSWHRLVTNDCVELLSPTTFRWLGRADHAINSGGLKIHPEMLEAEIRAAMPGLPPFYISAEPDARWGEHPVIIAEGDIPLDSVRAALHDPRTAPVRLVRIRHLPLTATGKLLRLPPDQLEA